MTIIRIFSISSFAAQLIFTTTSLAQRTGQTPDPERAAVQKVVAELALSIQSANYTAMDTLFRAGGVHILTDTATSHGVAEYRDKFLKPELAGYTGLQYTHSAVEAVVRGAVAWVAFRREFSGTAASGPPKVSGRGTAVLEKLNDQWKIVHLHVSR